MAKATRGRRRASSRQCRPTPYSLPSHPQFHHTLQKKSTKVFEKKDWEDAVCSVCMEYPHNAVLLLCSSHDKGCRPYMCGTSFRYANCLDQYKKSSTKTKTTNQIQSLNFDKFEVTELYCPLCRGQVKGWTVVEPAREFLNAKKRSCMHDDCSFVGAYRELRKHVRSNHPFAKSWEVDPTMEQKWRRLEREREREDVLGTIRSSMPGAVVFGDYVIEGSHYGFDTEEDEEEYDDEEEDDFFRPTAGERDGGLDSNFVNMFLLLHAFGQPGNGLPGRRTMRHDMDLDHAVGIRRSTVMSGFDSSGQEIDGFDDDVGTNDGISLVSRLRRQGRVLLGRSGRRQRRREVNHGRG